MARRIPVKANLEKHRHAFQPVVEVTGNGGILCYEKSSGRWFRSSRWDVEDGLAQFQAMLENGVCVCQNDLFSCLRIHESNTGRIYGWNSVIHSDGELYSIATMSNGYMGMEEPVLVLEPKHYPIKDFKEVF